MTDVSPARRLFGRLLLAGGALMLPLTASFSYAASAQDSDVQPVPVPPSAAPQAPLPPVPAAAPEAPLPPEAAPRPMPAPRIQRFELRRDGDEDNHRGPGEQRTFVMGVDGPMSKEQQKQFEKMRKEWEKRGAEWRAHAEEWRKLGEQQRQFALAHVPEVSTDCDKAGGDGARSWTDDGGRQHIVLCQRVIRDHAQMAMGQATMGLRMARNAIANNPEISASVRNEILGELDREIVRLEAEHP